MYIIFNENENFIYQKNITINTEKLVFDNNVIMDCKDIIYYPTIIDNRDNTSKFNLYFRSNILYYNKKSITKTIHDDITVCYMSTDGIKFRKIISDNYKCSIIFKGNSASHNFFVYHEKNKSSPYYNKFFGIGGKHNPKFVMDIHHPKDCVNNNQYIQIDCNEKQSEFLRGSKNKVTIVSPYTFSNCYANGLYLFNSDNGLKFNVNEKKSFLNGLDNDDKCDEYYGFGVFDTLSSLVYFNDQYILYNRSNPKKCYRYIKYSISKDLVNWSKFKFINIESMSYNNYNVYAPNIKKFNNILISISTNIEIKNNNIINCGVLLLSSKDGINWKKHDYIINFNIGKFKLNNNKTIHSLMNLTVHGEIINMNNNNYIYIHYIQSNKLVRYKFEHNRLLYITNDNILLQSEFFTKKITIYDNMININCIVEQEGFVKIEILDDNKIIIYKMEENDIIYKGNYYDKKLTWNGNSYINNVNIHIHCIFKNAKIYSFSGKKICSL